MLVNRQTRLTKKKQQQTNTITAIFIALHCTNNARQFAAIDVRWTGEGTTNCFHRMKQFPIFVRLRAYVFCLFIHTDILGRSGIVCITWHQVSTVLICPAFHAVVFTFEWIFFISHLVISQCLCLLITMLLRQLCSSHYDTHSIEDMKQID